MMDFINKIMKNNLVAKVFSVILAIALWRLVKSEENITMQFNAQIHIKHAEDIFLVDQNPQRVNVTLVGRRNTMQELKNKGIAISFDLANKNTTQTIQLPITRDKVDAPPEVFVKSIEPDSVEVKINKGIRKSLTINVKQYGTPSIEYTLKGAFVTPSVVEVFGPESILNEINSIETKPVSIDKMDRSFTQRVELEPVYPAMSKLPVVEVFVQIVKALKTQEFSTIKLDILKSPRQTGSISLKPQEVNLVVEGTETDLHNLKPDNITAYVMISDLKEGKYELPVRTTVAENCRVVKVIPEVAEVSIGGLDIKGK